MAMRLEKEALIERLKSATRGMTHEMIAARVRLEDETCNPAREHVSAALAGSRRYEYVLLGMANTFLRGRGAWRKHHLYTNEWDAAEQEQYEAA